MISLGLMKSFLLELMDLIVPVDQETVFSYLAHSCLNPLIPLIHSERQVLNPPFYLVDHGVSNQLLILESLTDQWDFTENFFFS